MDKIWCQIIFLMSWHFYNVLSTPSDTEISKNNESKQNTPIKELLNHVTLSSSIESQTGKDTKVLVRKKRQGGGKFEEASFMTNLKLMRIYLMLFKNMFSKDYVGGKHPLHPDVPKYFGILFRKGFYEFFFPPPLKSAVSQ